MATDNQSTAERGRRLAAQALQDRGARVTEKRQGNKVFLEVRGSDPSARILVRVKTRTGGTWQGSIRDGDPDPAPSRPPVFWVFVDLESAGSPRFFIVPDDWMRRNIHDAHQAYLRRHGGERAHSKDSTHHAIEPRRILQWKDRWDLIEL
jgi:hypothetical protein